MPIVSSIPFKNQDVNRKFNILDRNLMRRVSKMTNLTEVSLTSADVNASSSKKRRKLNADRNLSTRRNCLSRSQNNKRRQTEATCFYSRATKFWLKIYQRQMCQKSLRNYWKTTLALIRLSPLRISKLWLGSIRLTVLSSQWWAWIGTRWTRVAVSSKWLSRPIDN